MHRPRYDDWSLPKGKLDPGEHPLVGACREVCEETGSTADRDHRLPSVSYVSNRDRAAGRKRRRLLGDDRRAGRRFRPRATRSTRWPGCRSAERCAGCPTHTTSRCSRPSRPCPPLRPPIVLLRPTTDRGRAGRAAASVTRRAGVERRHAGAACAPSTPTRGRARSRTVGGARAGRRRPVPRPPEVRRLSATTTRAVVRAGRCRDQQAVHELTGALRHPASPGLGALSAADAVPAGRSRRAHSPVASRPRRRRPRRRGAHPESGGAPPLERACVVAGGLGGLLGRRGLLDGRRLHGLLGRSARPSWPVPRRRSSSPPGSPSAPCRGDQLLEAGARPERRHRGLLHLHRLAGARVARGSRATDALLEDTEAGDGHLVALGDRVLDLSENRVERRGRRFRSPRRAASASMSSALFTTSSSRNVAVDRQQPFCAHSMPL